MTVGLISFGRSSAWNTLRWGDGGEIQDFCLRADGSKYCRTDTYGAYRWNSVTKLWSQLLSTSSMPSEYWTNGSGVYCIVSAPSLTSTVYMFYQGVLFKSTNRGDLWVDTGLAHDPNDYSNDNASKGHSFKIAIDPQNPDFVVAGTPMDWNSSPTNSGVSLSKDGGATWTTIPVSKIPACLSNGSGKPGGYCVAFDPTSPIVGGFTQGIVVHSYGNGAYQSTDGGTSWTLMSGSPTTCVKLEIDPNGHGWVQDEVNGNQTSTGYPWQYVPGTGWEQLTNPLYNYVQGFAVDMANSTPGAAHLSACDSTGGAGTGHAFCVSTDSGATWLEVLALPTIVADDISWMEWYLANGFAGHPSIGGGGLWYDPSQSNVIYKGNGIGIFTNSPPSTNVSQVWTSVTAPIEQLVTRTIVASPNGQVFGTVEDQGVMVSAIDTAYPSTHGTDASFSAGNGVAVAALNPSTIVCMCTSGANDTSGVSNDNGQTWTKFNTLAGTPWIPFQPVSGTGGTDGGMVAASTDLNFCAVRANEGANNNPIYYTIDGGVTWLPSTGGSSTPGDFPYYGGQSTLEADAVTAGTFYIVLYNQSVSPNGVYRSTDGGATWGNVSSFHPGSFALGAKLKRVPGRAGGLYFTPGFASNDGLYYSTDGGSNWTLATNTLNVVDFGFGPIAPGKTSPSLWFYGSYNGVTGLYLTLDEFATAPTLMDTANPVVAGLSDVPAGQIDTIYCLDASKVAFKKVYLGFSGHGAAYRQF